jgi:hypothetical protein
MSYATYLMQLKQKLVACATCNGKLVVNKIVKDRFSFNVFH